MELELLPLRDDALDAPSITKRKMGVLTSAWLIVAEIVGTGVLALPGNVAVVGLGPGLAFIVVNLIVNLYVGDLLNQAATCVDGGDATRIGKRSANFIVLTRSLCGEGWALTVVAIGFYLNLFLVMGNYLVVMTNAVGALCDGGDSLCGGLSRLQHTVLASSVLLLLNQLPAMRDFGRLPATVSVVATIVVLAICLHAADRSPDDGGAFADHLQLQPQPPRLQLHHVAHIHPHRNHGGGVGYMPHAGAWTAAAAAASAAEGASAPAVAGEGLPAAVPSQAAAASTPSLAELLQRAAALSGIVFAIGTQKLLLNVRAEMRRPRQDATAALGGALAIFGVLYVATVLLAGPAPPGFLLDALTPSAGGTARRVAGGMLWLHVSISYAINSQALCSSLSRGVVGGGGGGGGSGGNGKGGLMGSGGGGGGGGGSLVGGGGGAVAGSGGGGGAKGGAAAGVASMGGAAAAGGSGGVATHAQLRWAALTTATTLLVVVVATSIPFFQHLVALTGALTSAPLTLMLPCLLYLRASAATAASAADAGTLDTADPDAATRPPTPTTARVAPPPRLRLLDRAATALIVASSALLMVSGTAGAVRNIAADWDHGANG